MSDQRDLDGCLISDQLGLPVMDDLESLSQGYRSRLEGMASAPWAKGKVDRQVLINVVLQLCEGCFIALRCIAELVNRKPDTLWDQADAQRQWPRQLQADRDAVAEGVEGHLLANVDRGQLQGGLSGVDRRAQAVDCLLHIACARENSAFAGGVAGGPRRAGADAVLVGEALMRQADVTAALEALIGG